MGEKNKHTKNKKMKNFNYFKNFDELMRDLLNESINYDLGSKYLVGKSKTEKGTDENGEWVQTTYESPDGSYSYTNFVRVGSNNKKTESKTNSKTIELQKQLSKAVEEQNYEEAVKLRDKIRKIEGHKEKIESLKSELEFVVKNQDYEKAIELRDEIKKLEK